MGNALEDSFGDMLTVTPKTPGGPDALSTIPDVQIDQQVISLSSGVRSSCIMNGLLV